jgi:hypothetical protein
MICRTTTNYFSSKSGCKQTTVEEDIFRLVRKHRNLPCAQRDSNRRPHNLYTTLFRQTVDCQAVYRSGMGVNKPRRSEAMSAFFVIMPLAANACVINDVTGW